MTDIRPATFVAGLSNGHLLIARSKLLVALSKKLDQSVGQRLAGRPVGQDELYERPRYARFSCTLLRRDRLQLYMRPRCSLIRCGPNEIR
jgi:hypothetical protein